MTLHKDLTTGELHESKGAAAATKGQVPVANGAGAAVFANLLTDTVFVNVLADFPAASGGKITLAGGTTYIVGTDINIGTDFLLFSTDSSLQSSNLNGANITYTGTVAMLQGADVDSVVKDITFTCANSDLFGWTDTGGGGNSTLALSDIKVTACKTVGIFNDIRAIAMNRIRVTDCTDGVVFLGDSNIALALSTLGFRSTDVGYVGIDFTGATLQAVDINSCIFEGGAGSIGIKGDAASANITTNFIATISNNTFAGVTTPLSGITVDDIRFKFDGNGVVADSQPDGLVSLSSNATVTTTPVGVPTLVAGTWAVERVSQFTGTTGGRLTYNGERDLVTPLDVAIVVEPASGTNKSIRAFVAVNGTEVPISGKSIQVDAGKPSELTIMWQEKLVTGDFVEVFIENETDSVNVTAIDAVLRAR